MEDRDHVPEAGAQTRSDAEEPGGRTWGWRPLAEPGEPAPAGQTSDAQHTAEPPTEPVPPAAGAPHDAPFDAQPPGDGWTPPGGATAPPPDVHAGSRGGGRSALVGGVAGALVGALVAGGLVVAFDDDPRPAARTPATVQAVSDAGTGDDAGSGRAPVVEQPGDIRSILEAARPAVVRVDVRGDGFGGGTGTGFIVDAGGVIVTNAHVVGNARSVVVHLADGTELDGRVVGRDARFDLAVVEVDADDLPTLELGDSDQLQVGDPVVAIGNALGISEGSGATVTTGIVSGLDRVVDVGRETLVNAIQTDAAINPGNSGGPLLDMDGRVVGINTAIASPDVSNNVGFAISISSAKPVIEALREGRDPQIAFLGVSTETVTARTADDVGVDRGAVVVDVTRGSAADDAGIRENDVIVEIDGVQVDEPADVVSVVRKHQPGDEIDVVLVRDGDRRSVTVTLGERPDGL